MITSDSPHIERAKNSILGALVADAATMGFHWCYSQRRIAELTPSVPEFREPDEADYAGGVGYFAHGMKSAGEFSHYGEQAWVLLRSMADIGGRYSKQMYQEAFRNHFGYGGKFHGYIDRPTRETLDTIYRVEHEAMARAAAIPFAGDPKQQSGIRVKILAAAKRLQGQELIDEAARIAATMEHPDACRGYAIALIGALAGNDEFSGAADEQLPAISKLPALVARYAGETDLADVAASAVKVTNNTPRALDYGMVATQLLSTVVTSGNLSKAIEAGVDAAGLETRDRLSIALSRNGTVPEITREFGLNCDLGAGVPSILVNLKSAASYTDGIRQNIYAGGDNCGRAIVLGAALGAAFGVGGKLGIPQDWVERVRNHENIMADIDRLFCA